MYITWTYALDTVNESHDRMLRAAMRDAWGPRLGPRMPVLDGTGEQSTYQIVILRNDRPRVANLTYVYDGHTGRVTLDGNPGAVRAALTHLKDITHRPGIGEWRAVSRVTRQGGS